MSVQTMMITTPFEWSMQAHIMAVAFASLILYATVKWYCARKAVNDLRKQGLPVAGWSWLVGSLSSFKGYMDRLPRGVSTKYAFAQMSLESNRGAIYADLWPFSMPILVINSPVMAAQIKEQVTESRRTPGANEGIDRITGGPSLVTLPHKLWKPWRTTFNPAFNPSYILDLTPQIVRCAETFVEKLRTHAKAKALVQLEDDTLRLALDVIGLVALNKEWDYQRKDAAIPRSLRKMIENTRLESKFQFLEKLNPLPLLHLAYHDRILRREIGKVLDECFSKRKEEQRTSRKGVKSIIACALEGYMAENKADEETLDPTFKQQASTQLRLFMFAGHDTTSSTIIYAYHLLSQNPDCLTRLRAELDAFLGPDVRAAGPRLSSDPLIINQLSYTTACIKETLRLYPAASVVRLGSPDVVLTDEDGTRYPTTNTVLYSLHFAIHRNPCAFPQPDVFNPERWLVGPEHPLHPPREAFRPFEHGARNCIGQTLAMLEIKVVLAMTAREFDIVPAYEEWDRLHPGGGRIKTAFGDRAFGVSDTAGGTHAAHKYPCRITVRA